MVKASYSMRNDHLDKILRSVGSYFLRGITSWLIAITMLIASACTTLTDDQITPSQTTPRDIVPATYTAIAAKTIHAMLTADTRTIPHYTSTPYPIPTGFDLSVPVYILSHNQNEVWRLDPQSVELERVSPREWQVTAFDISTVDGRMAFGTLDGKLIVELPDMEPSTILDLREESELPYYIRSLAWSPGGNRLAFAVYLDWDKVGSDPEAENMSGIWVWDLEKATYIRLIGNEYFPEDGDVNQQVTFSHPQWSPDGTGMIITGYYWEWINVHWLDPIEPDLEGMNLKNPLEWFWGDASWTRDGRSIMVSGLQYASVCDLYRVDRETLAPETLIDGEEQDRFIFLAQELPEGIAFVSYDEEFEPRLYFGKPSDTGIQYGLVGPDDPLCTSVAVDSVVWDPSGHYALISCHHDRRILSLDGRLDIDLDIYLGRMANEEYIEVYWGVDVEE